MEIRFFDFVGFHVAIKMVLNSSILLNSPGIKQSNAQFSIPLWIELGYPLIQKQTSKVVFFSVLNIVILLNSWPGSMLTLLMQTQVAVDVADKDISRKE